MTVAFVDGVCFGWEGRIDVSFDLLDVGHIIEALLFTKEL